MPTNRKRKARNIVPLISDAIRKFLETGEQAEDDHDLDVFLLRTSRERVKEIWGEVREQVLREWVQKYPCTRPWAWWEHDAPRWKRKFGAYFDGQLPEPRQRLGGIGTPDYEVLAHVPYFDRGIPAGWVSKSQEDFYNGRSVDIFGKKTNQKWPPGSGCYEEGDFSGKAIDPADPPKYESVASYLQRHGLLTPAEEKYLALHRELLEPELVVYDDDEEEEEEAEEETVKE